jgi:glutathione S-transferase/GST-like protein
VAAAFGASPTSREAAKPSLSNPWYVNLAARPAFKTAVSWPDESGGGYEEVGLGAKVK